MPSVAEGVKLGIQECQHQFRGRRWNCTTIKDNLAIFGPVLDKGKTFTKSLSCALTDGWRGRVRTPAEEAVCGLAESGVSPAPSVL